MIKSQDLENEYRRNIGGIHHHIADNYTLHATL